jgi:hypothetical protein
MRRFVKNQSGSVTPKENELIIIYYFTFNST